MKYKVGDKVLLKKHTEQKIFGNMGDFLGKVVTIKKTYGDGFDIEEDSCKWVWDASSIEGYADKFKIVITTEGNETIAKIFNGNKVIKTAKAKCSPVDSFDAMIGAKIAFERLMGEDKEKTDFIPHLLCYGVFCGNIGEETNFKDAVGRPLCVGDVVEQFDYHGRSYGDTVIVKAKLCYRGNEEKVYAIGIERACNDKTGEICEGWKVIKKRSFEEVANGEEVNAVKFVKFAKEK